MTTETPQKNIAIMLDSETLGLGANAVITQLAFISFDVSDPETILARHEEYLPIAPQLKLGRTMDASTVLYWITDPKLTESARKKFKNNEGDDMDELTALTQSFITKLAREIPTPEEGTYELWARGLAFDFPKIESLITDCGFAVPWAYDSMHELRTLMKLAGVAKREIPLRPGLVQHHALSDCQHQIDCYIEANRRLRASV